MAERIILNLQNITLLSKLDMLLKVEDPDKIKFFILSESDFEPNLNRQLWNRKITLQHET
jgi:hypothetical protein